MKRRKTSDDKKREKLAMKRRKKSDEKKKEN